MPWIYLSHVLAADTPLYGGRGSVRITRARSIAAGDAANSSELALPAHSGTHIDAPRHFVEAGMTLEDFPADYWRATRPRLISCGCEPGELLGLRQLQGQLEELPADCDALFLRSGFERFRASDPVTYMQRGPGLAPDLGRWLRQHRRLKFIGMDFVSASSFLHRAIGHEAHGEFLAPNAAGQAPVLLVEDMALGELRGNPKEVYCIPLRFTEADGAPITALARVE